MRSVIRGLSRTSSGIDLSYARPDGPAEDYATLALSNDGAAIATPASARSFLDRIRSELGRLKLGWAKRVEFTTFPVSS